MKYTNGVIINKPINEVVTQFDNPDNLKHWQPGLVSFDLVEGQAGQPGAKSKLVFKMGSRTIEMIETITVRDLPRGFSGTYEANGVWSATKNFFSEVDGDKTKIVTDNEFQFHGFMKLLGWLMPGSFKKQSQQYLDNFKVFVEDGKSVLDAAKN